MSLIRHVFITGLLLACGPLVAAEPAPAPTDQESHAVAEQLDRLIAAKLRPVRIRARLSAARAMELTQQPDAPATQPVELELELIGDDAQRLQDAERVQFKLAEEKRAMADEYRALAGARLAVVQAGQQSEGAYLGIGVDSPDETLRSQLALPPGAGLVVNFVDDDGPSKAVIHQHDVLQKLDDQLLVNGEQLITLVRMHKPGDTVSLTLLRQAKPVKLDVELGRRKTSQGNADPAMAGQALAQLQWSAIGLTPKPITLIPSGDGAGGQPFNYWANTGQSLSSQPTLDGRERPTTFNDGELLASFNGHGDLLAVDVKNGKILYHGPIGNEAQWNALPQQIKDKLSSWRSVVSPDATTPMRAETLISPAK